MTIELRGLISNLCVINNQLFMCNVVVSTIEPEGNISNDEDEALAHLTNDDELDKEDNRRTCTRRGFEGAGRYFHPTGCRWRHVKF